LGDFGTRDYAIASGNVGDVFEVSYDVSNPRLDLVVKGDLDREKTDSYTLVIVARDGGSPPRTGSLTLKVNVQVKDLGIIFYIHTLNRKDTTAFFNLNTQMGYASNNQKKTMVIETVIFRNL